MTAGADDARGKGLQRGAVWTVYCAAEGCSLTSTVQSRATAWLDVATPETNAMFLSFRFSPSFPKVPQKRQEANCFLHLKLEVADHFIQI